ncbi:Peroxisomal membrane protein 11A [Sarcoptes scabiei]|uniref:Peroxisomal membrane protein 11A n=1 Tax=Sarcoptes scabiei TaxID=52283 RepID=A0A834VD49_SARSC|nr:Peroxisomal membrane protein 11A [Sarcoptes scabiei]
MNSLERFNRFNEDRERIFRILQYTVHLIWAIQSKISIDDYGKIQRLQQIESMLYFTRQGLRLGKFLEPFRRSMHPVSDNGFVQTIHSMSIISRALYLVCDNLIWLTRIEFLSNNKQNRFRYYANSFFLYSKILTLVKNLYEMEKSHREFCESNSMNAQYFISETNRSQKILREFLAKNKSQTLNILENLCDILLCLKWLKKINLNPIFIGFLGLISSTMYLIRKK